MMKLDFLLDRTGAVIRDRGRPVASFAARLAVLVALVLATLAAQSVMPRNPALAQKPPLAGDMKDFVPAEAPKPLPPFTIADLDGKELGLDAFKGKVVVLNLWATWCVPCIKEMPSLERLSTKLKDKGVAVMSVSQDRGGQRQVGPFLEKQGLKALPIYLDPKGAVLKAINGRGLPTTVILDKEGREVGRLEGDAEWDGPNAVAVIEHYLK